MKKEIIRFVKNIFCFLLFALAFYVMAISLSGDFVPTKLTKNLIYNSGPAGHSVNRFAEIKNFENVDILFLGSSHAYRGFDNRIFSNNGFTSFNLGSSSQTPIQTQLLLNRYLTQLNPKIVIYEMYPISFTIDGIESSIDIISTDQIDFTLLKMAKDYNHIKLYNSLIYSSYRQFSFQKNNEQREKIIGNDRYISGGFVEKIKHDFNPNPSKNKKLIFKKNQLSAFQKNIEVLEKMGVKIYLVQAPMTSTYYNSFSNKSEFDSLINSYGEYYDFNKIVELTDSLHFFDRHHLNQSGVEIFNEKLIEVIFPNSK